ncbi:DUF3800 domain-containing protein [Siccirubricoccus sp. G192]|uniref:DUF3800 domain-containing protein n=1 Tax=Siccirubricoccus sp. G192 TaxID=2849651 RepID=UPI001C2C2014|nr:DUF3800 domain-containing protein [Siccirubricoccus sp. G192]MBV1800642.1 DUF3800 domain-containing protein [Siccirubricoccus sp. G192]
MQCFWSAAPRDRVVLVNQKVAARGGPAPVLYAAAVVETAKAGLAQFKRDVLGRETIGNVGVITDVNHHNDHPAFEAEIERARREDGRFRGVNRVARLDSAASRLLQLADMVAYSCKWIVSAELNATGFESGSGSSSPETVRAARRGRLPEEGREGGRQPGLSASGWPPRPPDTRPDGSHAGTPCGTIGIPAAGGFRESRHAAEIATL